MKTVDELVDTLGGTTLLARELRASPSTISNWRTRGSIPVEHWDGIIAIARKRGLKISADRLMAIHNERAAS